MNEKLKKQDRSPTEEEMEVYKAYMADHPQIETSSENLKECGPEVAELEAMIASFEESYNLQELHAIITLRPEDVPKHPIREPARIDLVPIVTMLKTLQNETNISKSKLGELKLRYQKLSQAVGIINKDIVNHTRIVGRI